MIGQCAKCKQIKNISAKGMCVSCYHKDRYNRGVTTIQKKRQQQFCVICGSGISKQQIGLCSLCRRKRKILENEIKTTLRKLETAERNLVFCELLENNIKTVTEIAEAFKVSRQYVSVNTLKGSDYFKALIDELKADFYNYSQQIKIIDKTVEENNV